jgi:hypothetical protein
MLWWGIGRRGGARVKRRNQLTRLKSFKGTQSRAESSIQWFRFFTELNLLEGGIEQQSTPLMQRVLDGFDSAFPHDMFLAQLAAKALVECFASPWVTSLFPKRRFDAIAAKTKEESGRANPDPLSYAVAQGKALLYALEYKFTKRTRTRIEALVERCWVGTFLSRLPSQVTIRVQQEVFRATLEEFDEPNSVPSHVHLTDFGTLRSAFESWQLTFEFIDKLLGEEREEGEEKTNFPPMSDVPQAQPAVQHRSVFGHPVIPPRIMQFRAQFRAKRAQPARLLIP